MSNSLRGRLIALEEATRAETATEPTQVCHEFETVRRESREALVLANDNEQYSRRNNIRVEGLKIQKMEDCRKTAADFCRNKLQLRNFDENDIETAHLVPGRPGSATSTTGTTYAAAAATTRAESMVLVTFRHREVRDAVIRQLERNWPDNLGRFDTV
jgi:hypothetical protein